MMQRPEQHSFTFTSGSPLGAWPIIGNSYFPGPEMMDLVPSILADLSIFIYQELGSGSMC